MGLVDGGVCFGGSPRVGIGYADTAEGLAAYHPRLSSSFHSGSKSEFGL